MTERHRYRTPLDVKPEPVGPADHTHEQPRGLLLLIKVLTAVVVVLLVTTGWLLFTTYMLQRGQSETTAYIEGRGAARDAENERLNERIDAAVCSLLDSLPAGPLLDAQREQYGCGPGIPVAELDPDAAQNLADILGQLEAAEPVQVAPTPAVPTSAPDDLPPGAPEGAQPSPMGLPPTTTPTSGAPATPAPTTTAPTTPPLVDLNPLTDPLCDLLGVCL